MNHSLLVTVYFIRFAQRSIVNAYRHIVTK